MVHNIRMITNSACLCFMDELQSYKGGVIPFYVILIPFIFTQTILLWMQINLEVAFDIFVSRMILVSDSVQWGFLVTAMLVEISGDEADITILAVAIVFSFTALIAVLILKKRNKRLMLQDALISNRNLREQLKLHYLILELSKQSIDSNEYNLLKSFYHRHQFLCLQPHCPSNRPINFNSTDHAGDCLLLSDEELLRGTSKEYIEKQMFETLFFHAKDYISCNDLYFLEIFLKINQYNHILSAYYMLIEIKDKVNSRKDQFKFDFLQNMIIQAYLTVKKKHEDYDAEKVMNIESEFVQYKLSIINATMHAQKFWASLSNKNIKLEELMILGDYIVESYMEQKHRFEELMRKQPDFSEAVLYNYQFCQNVMNFEVEAMNACNLFHKIEEKIRKTKQNLYNLSKKDFVIIMVTNKNGKKNQVIMVNKLFEIAVGVQAHHVIDKNINNFMPPMLSVRHDKLIENYLRSYNGVPYTRIWDRVWVKKLDETVLPVKAYLVTCISQTYGLVLVVFVEIAEPVFIQNLMYEATQPFYLIADESGMVTNMTPNFKEKFFKLKDTYLEDYKLNINDIFPSIDNFTSEQLDFGVNIFMNKAFFQEKTEARKYIDVVLKVNQYHFKLGVRIQELIFVQDMRTLGNIPTLTLSDENNDYVRSISQTDHFEGSVALRHLGDGTLDFSGGSISSESSNAKNYKAMILLKQQLDLSKLPQAFVNLQRGVFIFFIIMISTQLTMLSITVYQQNQFSQLNQEISNSIQLNSDFANLALTFRMLTLVSLKGVNQTLELTFQDIQNYLASNYQDFKDHSTQMLNNEPIISLKLQSFLYDQTLQLQEIQSNGQISISNSTLFNGAQQYMSKLNSYLTYNQSYTASILKGFYINQSINSNLTDIQRDVWFIIQNGNFNLRDYILNINQLYQDEDSSLQNQFLQLLLIIFIICICTTIIATLVLAPTTSSIDNEQLNVILKWNIVQETTKTLILQRIQIFNRWMAQVDADRSKIVELVDNPVNINQRHHNHQSYKDDSASKDLTTTHHGQFQNFDSIVFSNDSNPSQFIDPVSVALYAQTSYKYQEPSSEQNIQNFIQQRIFSNFKTVNKKMNSSIILHHHKEELSEDDKRIERDLSINYNQSVNNSHHPLKNKHVQLQRDNSDYQERSTKQIHSTYNNVTKTYHETAQGMIMNTNEDVSLKEQPLHPNPALKRMATKFATEKLQQNLPHISQSDSSYTYSLDEIMNKRNNQQRKNPSRQISRDTKQNQSQRSQGNQSITHNHTQEQFNEQDINKLFTHVKVRRYGAFLAFALLIIGFQVAQFLINQNLINHQFESFKYQQTFSDRLTCLSTSFRFMLESFVQNYTITLSFEKQTVDDYILNNCMRVESDFQNYERNQPAPLSTAIDDILIINSDQACSWLYGSSDISYIQNCQSMSNGLMKNGVSSVISQLYYYETNSLLQFQSIYGIGRTKPYLNDQVYRAQSWQYLRLINEILKPICYQISSLIDSSIQKYIDTQMKSYYAVVAIFIAFLIISLIVVIKCMLIALKKIVLRSRILIKIIPIEDLKSILENEKSNDKAYEAQIQQSNIQANLYKKNGLNS